jgi:hypothetical protein
MANNYVQFSAELALHSVEEKRWLQEQLDLVEVATLTDTLDNDDRPRSYIVPPDADDYREGYDPAGTFPRFLYDMPDSGFDGAGFECEWDAEEEPGSVVFYAEECGWPDRVGFLIQKYLRRFHPGECWSLTWSETCSKPHVGEFGGGGMLVTAERMIFLNAHEFVEQQQARFERIGTYEPDGAHPDFRYSEWVRAVNAGQTRLGYWDWVLDRLDGRDRPSSSNDD